MLEDPPGDGRRRVARYELVAPLGAGGMGTVHRARDPQLDRAIAIKLVAPERGREPPARAAARLIREARAMAAVHHEHVLPIYDFGVTGEAGDVFIAMELVEGCDLSKWLQDDDRSTGDILRVFGAAGQGLAAAHAAGLVHRDFKPSNVLLGNDGRVRVCDFGLAWRPGDGPTDAGTSTLPSHVDGPGPSPSQDDIDHERLTETGTVLGTPSYMAPEQRTRDPLDARTDQFALCVALWEALYRSHPFGTDRPDRARRVLLGEHEPLPPARGEPARLRRALLRGLSSDPADRFESLTPLLAAMRPRPTRRWGWVAAAGVLVVVGGFVGPTRAPAEPPSTISTASTVAAGDDDGSAPIGTEATQTLAEVEALREEGRLSRSASLATALLDAADDDATRAAASLQRGLTRSKAGDHDGAAEDLEASYLLAHPAGWALIAADAALALVKAHGIRAQRYADGREWAEHAEAALQRARAQPEQWVRLAALRGELEHRAGRHDAAILHFEHALGLIEDAKLGVSAQAASVYLGACQAHTDQGRLDEAHLLCDRAIDLFGASRGRAHPSVAVAMSAKAVAFLWANRNEEARRLLERAIAHQEAARGEEDQELTAMLNNYSAALTGLGAHDEAIAAAQRVVDLRTAAHGASHPATAIAVSSLAGALLNADRVPEATQQLQHAVSVLESLEEGNPKLPYLQSGLGMMYAAQGEHGDAMRYHERAALSVVSQFGPESPRLVMVLSRMLRDARDPQRRLSTVRRLRAIAMRDDVPDVDAKTAWAAIAGALRKDGDPAAADEAHTRALELCESAGASRPVCERELAYDDLPAATEE